MMTEKPQHHIACVTGDVAPCVLLPGDPSRAKVIAELFDEYWHVKSNREYVTYSGRTGGLAISVTSTGIGCPSASIAVEELANIGARVFIRVGTCGGFQSTTNAGDVIVVTAAVRGEGTSVEYIPLEYPAVADYRVVLALGQAAEALGIQPQVGMIRSHDAFYIESPLAHGDWRGRIRKWAEANVLAVENESSAIYVVSSLRRLMAGTILVVVHSLVSDRETKRNDIVAERIVLAARAAILAVHTLVEADPSLGDFPLIRDE